MKKLNSKKFKIILSAMALVEVIALATGITFSWIEGGNRGTVYGKEFILSAGSSLTLKANGQTADSIAIPPCLLEEVSSADGRNFFFPLKSNTSNQTSNMTFREGTATDRNSKYVSFDFQLIAGESAADVYFSYSTEIRCDNENVLNALKMSLSTNDSSDPIVFNPKQSKGNTDSYSAIMSLNDEGKVKEQSFTSTKSIYDYMYFDDTEAIYHLESGETLNLTLSLWLEGTEFSGDDVTNEDIRVFIDFTTQQDMT